MKQAFVHPTRPWWRRRSPTQPPPALWTAWRGQLQRLYTIDLDTQGHGLYLVLWFGKKPATHPQGIEVRDAAQLRRELEACIPAIDRHPLAVQVLDLSWPGT